LNSFRPTLLIVLIALAANIAFIQYADAQVTFDPRPTLKLLDKCVNTMTSQVKRMTEAQRSKILPIVETESQELHTVQASYSNKSRVDKDQFFKALAPFFDSGVRLRKALSAMPASNKVRTAAYSPDPQQCANHCYRTCGYGSIGEKVCWFTCYHCCGRGGC
jgi:hypothetical protein